MAKFQRMVGVFAAVFLVNTASANDREEQKGLPEKGIDWWSVYSCAEPYLGTTCRVPVAVKVTTLGNCSFRVADFVEIESSKIELIRWKLIDDEPEKNRQFRFGHSGSPAAKGIKFEMGGETDFPDETGSTDLEFRKKLSTPLTKLDPKLFLYDIFVEWFDPAQARYVQCKKRGPAIINRG